MTTLRPSAQPLASVPRQVGGKWPGDLQREIRLADAIGSRLVGGAMLAVAHRDHVSAGLAGDTRPSGKDRGPIA